MRYQGRCAIVTGGASGIGLGIVESFAKQGGKVAILDRNHGQGSIIAGRLGKDVIFVQTDVASWTSVSIAFQKTAAAFGDRIDYVFANAGISQMTGMRQTDPTHYATSAIKVEDLALSPPDLSVMDVNVKGVLYTVYLALAYFRRQSRDEDGWKGKIIVTGSTSSIYPCPNDTLYGVSKHAVLGLTRSLAPKVLTEGITINALAPSIVRTALGPKEFFDAMEKEGRVTPMSTLTHCVDKLLDGSCKLTGQLAELTIDTFKCRNFPAYIDDIVRRNMDEFHPVDETEEALAQQ